MEVDSQEVSVREETPLYKCGCNKTYQSYSALYTHIKMKHDSIFPANTIFPKKSKKKGRPNKLESDKQEELASELKNFLDMLGDTNSGEPLKEEAIISNFPLNQFVDKQIPSKLLIEISNSFKKLQDIEGKDLSERLSDLLFRIRTAELDPSSYNVYSTFSLFLICLLKNCSFTLYKEFSHVLVLYCCMLNEEGYERLQIRKEIEKEFCEIQSTKQIAELSNYFILNYYNSKQEKTLTSQYMSELKFFSSNDKKMVQMVYMLKLFFKWLFINGFSDLQVNVV